MVGAGRFERPTPCAQGRCATRLRYAPTFVALLILNHFLDFRYHPNLPNLPKARANRRSPTVSVAVGYAVQNSKACASN